MKNIVFGFKKITISLYSTMKRKMNQSNLNTGMSSSNPYRVERNGFPDITEFDELSYQFRDFNRSNSIRQ